MGWFWGLVNKIKSIFKKKDTEVIVKQPVPSTPVSTNPTPTQKNKVTQIILMDDPSSEMPQAKKYFEDWVNSQEFADYFLSQVKELTGGNYSDPKEALEVFRRFLSEGTSIAIYWYNYGRWSNAIGGFDGEEGIAQNPRIYFNAIERAAHFCHECSHAAGLTHDGNRITPYIEGSFPYQIGYKFEEFLYKKFGK
jgi:hypothetical protein